MAALDPGPPVLSPLPFQRFATGEMGSLAHLFGGRPARELCGIYVLHFADGGSYVGKAENIVRRYADHRRRWSDIVSLEFGPCARRDLDEYERRVVSEVEKTKSLRNLLLAGKPGGWGDLEIISEHGVSIALPWDRGRRALLTQPPRLSPVHRPEGAPSRGPAQERFTQLTRHPQYGLIRQLVARYVHETIPDPALTAGGAWVLVALPSTSRSAASRRLLTLSCGGLETLYVLEENYGVSDARIFIIINVFLCETPRTAPASRSP